MKFQGRHQGRVNQLRQFLQPTIGNHELSNCVLGIRSNTFTGPEQLPPKFLKLVARTSLTHDSICLKLKIAFGFEG